MYRHLFTALLTVGVLTACQDKAPPPAPKPAAAPVDPQKLEQQKLEKAAQEVAEVANAVRTKHPETSKFITKINRVDLGPPSNKILFELITPESILYTDSDVSFMLVGSLFLGQGKEVQNFTARPQAQEALAAAKAQFNTSESEGVSGAEFFKNLPLNSGFNIVYGDGRNHIAVFEDPDCAFCQKLHKNLEEFGEELNIRVTVFPFILENKHPNAVARAKAIMCAADPALAWKQWMLVAEGQEDMDAAWATWAPKNAPTADCPQAVLVDGWQSAGKELKFSATPTIVFADGTTVEGALSKEDFQQMFEAVAQKLAAAPASDTPPAVAGSAAASAAASAQQALDDATSELKAPACSDDGKPCATPVQP